MPVPNTMDVLSPMQMQQAQQIIAKAYNKSAGSQVSAIEPDTLSISRNLKPGLVNFKAVVDDTTEGFIKKTSRSWVTGVADLLKGTVQEASRHLFMV